jgi:hypothetical protein
MRGDGQWSDVRSPWSKHSSSWSVVTKQFVEFFGLDGVRGPWSVARSPWSRAEFIGFVGS